MCQQVKHAREIALRLNMESTLHVLPGCVASIGHISDYLWSEKVNYIVYMAVVPPGYVESRAVF